MNVFISSENKGYIQTIKDALGSQYQYTNITSQIDVAELQFCDLLFVDQQNKELLQLLATEETLKFPVILLYDQANTVNVAQLPKNISSILSPFNNSHADIQLLVNISLNNFQTIKKIQEFVYHDFLTKINNRHAFFNHLNQLIHQYQENDISFCLAMMDIDNFKSINDNYGHIKGDELLEKVAQIMKKNCRSTDLLARIGGEEFAILFTNTELEQAYAILERIRKSIALNDDIDNIAKVTMSAGLIKVQTQHIDVNTIMHDADILLYKAKGLGKNQICI